MPVETIHVKINDRDAPFEMEGDRVKLLNPIQPGQRVYYRVHHRNGSFNERHFTAQKVMEYLW